MHALKRDCLLHIDMYMYMYKLFHRQCVRYNNVEYIDYVIKCSCFWFGFMQCDIYFCTVAGPGGSPKEKSVEQRYTPPSSPSGEHNVFR